MSPNLSATQLARDLAVRDLTDRRQGAHGIQQLIDAAVSALIDTWGSEVRLMRGLRVVPLADNYDNLLYPPEAVTRDRRYTRYVDSSHVLRSHTSAMIPPALRELSAEPVEDVLLACPGVVYRRDSIDRLHTGTPHQLDLWRISKAKLDDGDMDTMIDVLVRALAADRHWRQEPRVHPYTLKGRQVDVSWGDKWVEVSECGIAHPEVLARAGLQGWSGLALGMGLDRLMMLHKDIPDIRLLRSTDPRVADQMLDLAPYRAVSNLPPINRDLSIAVGRDEDGETLGDRIRLALSDDADLIESVTILSERTYESVPEVARQRLGMRPDHKNVLVRLAIRPHDRTLTDLQANELRDSIYEAVHQGSRNQWSTRGVDGEDPLGAERFPHRK